MSSEVQEANYFCLNELVELLKRSSIKLKEMSQKDFLAYYQQCNQSNVPICLPKTNLNGLSFQHGVKFVQCNLKHSILLESDLKNCNFEHGLLEETDFSNSTLEQCVFSDANLKHSAMKGCNLHRCTFVNTQLENADFSNSSLLQCDF